MSAPRLDRKAELNSRLRAQVIKAVKEGRLTVQRAAESLGKSPRQVYRLLAAARRGESTSLPHGNKGREPINKIPRKIWDEVIQLARNHYTVVSDLQLHRLLREQHNLTVGRESLRKQLRAAGIPPKRERAGKASQQRKRR
jgi:transposase